MPHYLQHIKDRNEQDEDRGALIICALVEEKDRPNFDSQQGHCDGCDCEITISKTGMEFLEGEEKYYVCFQCALEISPHAHIQGLLGADRVKEKYIPKDYHDKFDKFVEQISQMPLNETRFEEIVEKIEKRDKE